MDVVFPYIPRSKYGKHHRIEIYLEDLIDEYFEDREIEIGIKWGRRPSIINANNCNLGQYLPDRQLIVISPILDSRKVPKYFIKHVIFHELLHSIIPWEQTENGAAILHTETFREAEAKYKYHNKSMTWEDNHLHKLLVQYQRTQRNANKGIK